LSLNFFSGEGIRHSIQSAQKFPVYARQEAGLNGVIAPTGTPFAYDTIAMGANVAYLARFAVKESIRVNSFSVSITTGTATVGGEAFDFGLYEQTSSTVFTRLVSTAAVLVAASETPNEAVYTSDLSQFGDTELRTDKVYWAAVSCAGTPTVRSAIIPTDAGGLVFDSLGRTARFLLTKAASHPLPATITSPSAIGEAPVIGIAQA
jgi:hypothetical protein